MAVWKILGRTCPAGPVSVADDGGQIALSYSLSNRYLGAAPESSNRWKGRLLHGGRPFFLWSAYFDSCRRLPGINNRLKPHGILQPYCGVVRSEEHQSELQSLMTISSAVFR